MTSDTFVTILLGTCVGVLVLGLIVMGIAVIALLKRGKEQDHED